MIFTIIEWDKNVFGQRVYWLNLGYIWHIFGYFEKGNSLTGCNGISLSHLVLPLISSCSVKSGCTFLTQHWTQAGEQLCCPFSGASWWSQGHQAVMSPCCLGFEQRLCRCCSMHSCGPRESKSPWVLQLEAKCASFSWKGKKQEETNIFQ